MLTLNNLKSPKGANRDTKRIGRGQGSGQGTQAGKGNKGQKARKSGHVRTGFIGGALHLYKRLPKRGFSNAPFKIVYNTVQLSAVAEFFDGEVSKEEILKSGIASSKKASLPLKVLFDKAIEKPLVFKGVEKFSKNAVIAVENAGGKIVS